MGYAVLDGFDLGVGMLHLFSKKDQERRLMLNSIGPVWDGNEVWLVTAGGAVFAGFPDVYATFCSAFYVPIMILLAALIFRAVAIEFRSKQPMAWWRWTWDFFFSFGSLIIALALGISLAISSAVSRSTNIKSIPERSAISSILTPPDGRCIDCAFLDARLHLSHVEDGRGVS